MSNIERTNFPQNSHDIDPHVDEYILFQATPGVETRLDNLRNDDDPEFIRASMTHKDQDSGELISKQARIRRRLSIDTHHAVEYIEHNKGKATVVGIGALVIGATGIVVSRFKHRRLP